jgi:AhpC/TSA family
MRIWALILVSASLALATVPVRDGCTEDSSVIVTIKDSDPISVKHGVVGEASACYAVSVTQAGAEVTGYVLGDSLPAVVEFERKRAAESRVPVPEPPPPPPGDPAAKKTAVDRPTGPPFEPWSGTDVKGKKLQIGGANAKVTLVVFWAPQSASGRRYAEMLSKTGNEFQPKGVKSFGVVPVLPKDRLDFLLDDLNVSYPLAFDKGMSAKYGVDIAKGTTLVIDSSNHIIASSSDPKEIRATVVKLLSLD